MIHERVKSIAKLSKPFCLITDEMTTQIRTRKPKKGCQNIAFCNKWIIKYNKILIMTFRKFIHIKIWHCQLIIWHFERPSLFAAYMRIFEGPSLVAAYLRIVPKEFWERSTVLCNFASQLLALYSTLYKTLYESFM